MKYSEQDIERLREDLKFHIEAVARDILGVPVNGNPSRELKYGSKGGSLSVTIAKSSPYYGTWKDWQTGEGGDALSLIQKFKGLSFLQAVDYAQKHYSVGRMEAQQKEEVRSVWTPLMPVPENVPDPDFGNAFLAPLIQGKEITGQYAYRDEENRLLGYVIRVESENQEGRRIKETLPLTYCENQGGKKYWRWKGFSSPKPLYGLERLKEGKPILIVEGEKTAEAAQKLFPTFTVITWNGGVASAAKADWTPLKGRDVTLWPDHDDVGRKAAQDIASLLRAQDTEASLSLVNVPESFPVKWDLADAPPSGVSYGQMMSLLENAPAFVFSQEEASLPLPSPPEKSLEERLRPHLKAFSHSLFGAPVREEGKTLYFGEDGSLSVTRSGKDTGKWWDTKLKKGSDILDLVMHPLSSVKESIPSLKDKSILLEEWISTYEKAHPSLQRPPREQEERVWIPQERVPEDAVLLFTGDPEGSKIFAQSVRSPDYKILEAYAYHEGDNALLGYRLEVERELLGGKKTHSFLPVRWCERTKGQTSEKAWRVLSWEAPRPLFGLEQLSQMPSSDVLIIEGEKAALHARAYFPEMAVVTWMTGTSEYKTDWEVLGGRKVFLWSPDRKRQGQRGRFLLRQGLKNVHLLSLPSEFPKGWDFIQPLPTGWTKETMKELVKRSSWSEKLPSLQEKIEKEKVSPEASKPAGGATILNFPLKSKLPPENQEQASLSSSKVGVQKEGPQKGEKPKERKKAESLLTLKTQSQGQENPEDFSSYSLPFLPATLKKEDVDSKPEQEASAVPPSTPDTKSSPKEADQEGTPSAPPYGQVSAASALAQLLSFPILTTAELAQGVRKGIQKGIERFIHNREKNSPAHASSLADFYVRDASLYTRETLELIQGLQKSPPFARLSQKIRKESQEKGLSVETVAQSEEIARKFSEVLNKNPSLKRVAVDIIHRLSEGERRWKEATEALSKSGEDVRKVFKEEFVELHERLKKSLQGIPPVDGKKLQEMARILIENLKALFSRLIPFQKELSHAPQL